MQKNKLYIGNLSFKINQDSLREEFSSCGDIESVRLIKDRKTGRSKGFAFVTFADAQGAEQALMKDGVEMDGRALKVNVALEKSESPERSGSSTPKSRAGVNGSSPFNKTRLFDWVGGIILGLLLSWLSCFLF